MASFAAAAQLLLSASSPSTLSHTRFSALERSPHRAGRLTAPRRRSSLRFRSSALPDVQEIAPDTSAAPPPVQEIPGSYGLPVLGSLLDRFNYFIVQGKDEFFLSRMQRYNSSVIRVNMSPGPPFFPDSRTIMCLDQKSIQVLFDTSKVDKKDVFTGSYTPSTDFTGGFRVLSYLDPSEPKHKLLKEFCFEVLKYGGRKFLPEIRDAFQEAATEWEAQIAAKGEAEFATVCQNFSLRFLCKALLGVDPRTPGPASLGEDGPSTIQAWLALQVAPQTSLGLPKVVEALLHTIPLPFFLVSSKYSKVYQFFKTNGQQLLDIAEEKFGLDREEACHNLLFFTCFNTWGGVQIFMPSIIQRIASAGVSFQRELAKDVRGAIGAEGVITMKALEEMKLVHSTVYEVFRMDPPVPYQYGRAKSDMIIESHDASYRVQKEELLAAYQGIAMRDPKVFDAPDTFKPTRFMGAEGEKLLQNLTWSNGPETQDPTVKNKQCAGKDFVIFMARMLITEIYLRYDFLEIEAAGASFKFKVLQRRTPDS